uniref:Mitochondrial import inner membrane translocase subunit n=1 Tax=Oncorhynchus mykiss TaxID=8022 RepID=A0A8C7QY19_ONCMY
MAAQVTEADQITQNFLAPTINSENCFMDCVRDFTTREVKPESTCSESSGLMGPRQRTTAL